MLMNSLFGISMDTILTITLILFLLMTAVVAALGLRNRLLLKLGLRNIPRRRAQTTLIIVGLMLSTVIITSAFGTGDTVSYSIRSLSVVNLGGVDETVTSAAQGGLGFAAQGSGVGSGGTDYFAASTATHIQNNSTVRANTDGVVGVIAQRVPLKDLTTRQTKANTTLLGVPADYPTAAFHPLTAGSGAAVSLTSLGANEVYINDQAAHALGAHAGDRLTLYIADKPVSVVVRDILRDNGLATGGLLSGGQAAAPAVLLPLNRLQRLTGHAGRITTVLISNRGDDIAGGQSSLSSKIADAVRAQLVNPAAVAAAKSALGSAQGQAALRALEKTSQVKGSSDTLTKVRDLRTQATQPVASDRFKSLLGDPTVVQALRDIKDPAVGAPLSTALVALSNYSVQTLKSDGLTSADQFGSAFSTLFIVFGLFSIAAGIMLIFLIFVMLAAERRPEMGMARAIGTKRRHLIEQFLFEGYAYDLGASLVGVLLGIGVGLAMVSIMAGLFGAGGFGLQSHIELRSVMVAFCLGAIVTFLTVSFSSWRVSRLNVVAAIRDLPDDLHVDGSLRASLARSVKGLRRIGILKGVVFALILLVAFAVTRSPVVAVLATAVLYLLWAFRPAWVALSARGPLLLLIGAPLLLLGISTKQASFFGFGASLLLIGAAMLLRWILGGLRVPDRVRNRIGYSLAGIALVVYWLLPFDAIRKDLNGGIEMFFVSGMMLVLGGVWTVMYNSDLLLGALLLIFGRLGGATPVLRMAVTYPIQQRFRTGLTLSMFSLVIFTLMIVSVLTGSFSGQGLSLARDRGGYDIYGATSPANPVRDVAARVKADPSLRSRVAAAGGIGQVPVGLRQPGQRVTQPTDQTWQPYRANIADDSYLTTTSFTLHGRATGYGSDAAVWQALRAHPGYAVVDGDVVPAKNGGRGGGRNFQIAGFHYEDKSFTPARIQMRDVRTGAIIPLTVIGVLDRNATGSTDVTYGVYTGQSTLAAARDAAVPPTELFFRAAPGQDVHQTALAIGAAFLPNGLDVVEAQAEYNTNQSINAGLFNLLEGFMGLGLVVGIAALGVVATRAVVERRQQIGMMRAIGFKRRTVQTAFLVESSFVAILGTVLGVVLGLVLARNLVASFAKGNPGLSLVVPWTQIGIIVLIAYLASLLTTYLPAWQASRVYPAEALRYE